MTLKRTVQYLLRRLRRTSRAAQAAVDLRPIPGSSKAWFNFTVDFELCWGKARTPDGLSTSDRTRSAELQAQNFEPFLRLLEDLKMPTTWAVVGILCGFKVELEERERFEPKWGPSDWYQPPFEIQLRPELWDGRPYLERLRSLGSLVETLSHGYAHIDYADPETTLLIAERDMVLGVESLRQQGIEPNGFVYPCNRLGATDLLPSLGLSIARGDSVEWRLGVPLLTPIGFWISPGMMSWREIRRTLHSAARLRAWFHPWMHLAECDLRQRDIDDFYRPLFEEALALRSAGQMEIVSFNEVAKRLRQPA